jgi:hypothetical protein
VIRPFNSIEKVGDAVVAQPWRKTHLAGLYYKTLPGLRIAAGNQATPEQAVHRSLEGVTRAPLLLLHKHGNVVVDSESGSHIMMFSLKAS